MRRFRSVSLAAALFLATGCVADDEQPEVIETDPPVTSPAQPVAQGAPDTTAAALWAHLGSANYESWPMFPGKGRLYQGAEPHGMLLTTYVNEVALQALRGGGALPAGAILVKENYMPDSTLAAVTVMHKVSGYDAANGNWFWAKYDTAGVPEVSGRATMCQDCHRGSQRDFILTALPGN